MIRFAAFPRHFSPNGDGYRDTVKVGFDLSRNATVSFAIVDSEGNDVRTLADDRALPGDHKYRYRWNGRDDDGRPVAAGVYFVRLRLGPATVTHKVTRLR